MRSNQLRVGRASACLVLIFLESKAKSKADRLKPVLLEQIARGAEAVQAAKDCKGDAAGLEEIAGDGVMISPQRVVRSSLFSFAMKNVNSALRTVTTRMP